MSLPDLMTEHGITRSLKDCRDGNGYAIGDAYRRHLLKNEWINDRGELTPEGEAELLRRAPV